MNVALVEFVEGKRKTKRLVPTSDIKNFDPSCAQDIGQDDYRIKWQKSSDDLGDDFDGCYPGKVLLLGATPEEIKFKAKDANIRLPQSFPKQHCPSTSVAPLKKPLRKPRKSKEMQSEEPENVAKRRRMEKTLLVLDAAPSGKSTSELVPSDQTPPVKTEKSPRGLVNAKSTESCSGGSHHASPGKPLKETVKSDATISAMSPQKLQQHKSKSEDGDSGGNESLLMKSDMPSDCDFGSNQTSVPKSYSKLKQSKSHPENHVSASNGFPRKKSVKSSGRGHGSGETLPVKSRRKPHEKKSQPESCAPDLDRSPPKNSRKSSKRDTHDTHRTSHLKSPRKSLKNKSQSQSYASDSEGSALKKFKSSLSRADDAYDKTSPLKSPSKSPQKGSQSYASDSEGSPQKKSKKSLSRAADACDETSPLKYPSKSPKKRSRSQSYALDLDGTPPKKSEESLKRSAHSYDATSSVKSPGKSSNKRSHTQSHVSDLDGSPLKNSRSFSGVDHESDKTSPVKSTEKSAQGAFPSEYHASDPDDTSLKKTSGKPLFDDPHSESRKQGSEGTSHLRYITDSSDSDEPIIKPHKRTQHEERFSGRNLLKTSGSKSDGNNEVDISAQNSDSSTSLKSVKGSHNFNNIDSFSTHMGWDRSPLKIRKPSSDLKRNAARQEESSNLDALSDIGTISSDCDDDNDEDDATVLLEALKKEHKQCDIKLNNAYLVIKKLRVKVEELRSSEGALLQENQDLKEINVQLQRELHHQKHSGTLAAKLKSGGQEKRSFDPVKNQDSQHTMKRHSLDTSCEDSVSCHGSVNSKDFSRADHCKKTSSSSRRSSTSTSAELGGNLDDSLSVSRRLDFNMSDENPSSMNANNYEKELSTSNGISRHYESDEDTIAQRICDDLTGKKALTGDDDKVYVGSGRFINRSFWERKVRNQLDDPKFLKDCALAIWGTQKLKTRTAGKATETKTVATPYKVNLLNAMVKGKLMARGASKDQQDYILKVQAKHWLTEKMYDSTRIRSKKNNQ